MKKLVISFILVVSFILILRTAWLSDDAYITFRTIDNFVHGYGLVWNIGERVQTYTNPLWMFFLSLPYFFTHEIYFTSIFVSILVTLITIYWLLFKTQKHIVISLITGAILLSSHAFIDFSTSGLENPFTHLLLVIFSWIYFFLPESNHRKTLLLSIIASLCMVNRLDIGILVLPATFYTGFKNFSWRKLGQMLLGIIPVIMWELFAFIYYGFIFPNTYYAKLFTGIPLSALIQQGFSYVLDSLSHDPITLLIIFSAIIINISFYLYFRHTTASTILNPEFRIQNPLLLSFGSFLYILYTIRNGGDFMSGRFFSAPFVLALASLQPLAEHLYENFIAQKKLYLTPMLAGCSIFLIAITCQLSAPLSHEPAIPANGIDNERDFYFPTTGLVNLLRSDITPPHPWAVYGDAQKKIAENITDHRYVVTFPNVGMLGYFAGPKVYIIDPLGLTDPFLAHQKIDISQPWRVGHYIRALPEGYQASKEQQKNLLIAPQQKELYAKYQSIISDSLFTER